MKNKGFDFSCISEPHELILTGSTSVVIFEDGEKMTFSDGSLKPHELNFVKKTRAEIIKNATDRGYQEMRLWSDYKFFDIAAPEYLKDGATFNNSVVEIDINNAYWNAAFNLSLICRDTYNKGLEMSKKVRLISVGSAASRKNHFYFNGEDYEYLRTDENIAGISSFFRISEYIGEIVSHLFNKHNLLMYWVDAIFVPKNQVGAVCEYLELAGMEYKVKPIDVLKYVFRADRVEVITIREENGEKKEKKYTKKTQKETEKTVFLRHIMEKALNSAKNE